MAPRKYKIYVDMSTRNIYNSNGVELNDNTCPYIYYKENLQLQIQYLNSAPGQPPVDADLDKYVDLAGQTITNSAVVDNNNNHYDEGALNAGKSGTVTSIVVKNLEAAPRLKSGTMLLINSAGESESVAFTNYSVTSSIYTFTVSATLTYTYLTDDTVRVKETPIIKSEDADIDDTDKDTGLFLVNLDGYTQVFQELAEGTEQISSCKFEHQIFDDTGKLIFALKFPFLCFGLLDDAGSIPPAPDDDYYTKTQVDALLRAGYELQFSIDGETLWHDTQVEADRYWRYRYPEGEWSPAIELVEGPDGDAGWSPVLAVVTDSDRRVLQVIDWVGGEGTKPATGSYIGTSGLVENIADAVDIRGPAGADGADAPEVQIQYSSDNASFHDTWVSGDIYIRYSTDGGSTWTTGKQFTSSGVNTDVEFDNADLSSGILTVTGTRTIVSIVDNSGAVIVPDDITYGAENTTVDLSSYGTISGTWKVLFAQGKDGTNGTNGTDGVDGVDGTNGVDGTDGTDGISFVWQGAYSAAVTYAANDVVSYSGSSYISLQGSNLNKVPGVDTDYWSLMAQKGEDGSGAGSTDDTSRGDGTWIDPDKSPSQRAVEEALNDAGIRYADRSSNSTDTDHERLLIRNVSASDSNTILLLHFDGENDSTEIVDSSIKNQTVTAAGDAKLSTTSPKFGTASLTLNGTNAYASVTDTEDLDLGVGGVPFTLRAWIKTSTSANMCIFNRGGGGGDWNMTNGWQYLLQFETSNEIVFYYNNNGSSVRVSKSHTPDGNWHQVLVSYDGTTTKVAVDGTFGTGVTTGAYYKPTTSNISRISSYQNGSGGYWTGNIDEFIINNKEALYTTDFTPQSSALSITIVRDNRMSSVKVSDIPRANLFTNGTFAVWQRGTSSSSISSTRTYLADRWAVKAEVGTLTTVARSTTVPSESRSKYSLELTGATGVTTVTVDQRIEAANVPKSTVYFSAYVYNGSGAAFIPKLYVSTPSASDNWTTSSVINGSGSGESLQSCADSAWTKVYWTADISGYSNIDNGVEFKIGIPSGSLVSGDTVRVADVVLTYGSSFAEPIVKTQGQVLYECMRYYWIQTSIQSFGGYGYYAASAGQSMGIIAQLPSPMRIAPTVTKIGTWIVSNCGQPTASNPSPSSVSLTASATAAGRCAFYNDAGTGLSFDAEL